MNKQEYITQIYVLIHAGTNSPSIYLYLISDAVNTTARIAPDPVSCQCHVCYYWLSLMRLPKYTNQLVRMFSNYQRFRRLKAQFLRLKAVFLFKVCAFKRDTPVIFG